MGTDGAHDCPCGPEDGVSSAPCGSRVPGSGPRRRCGDSYDPLGDDAPESPVPWRPRCSSASPLVNARGSRAAHGRRLWPRGRGANAHRDTLCQRPWLFAARQYPCPRTPAGSVGAPDPVYGPRRRVPGAPHPRRQRRSRLIPSPTRGRTGPRACAFRPWNSWRSWPRSCPCHASIWCAMGAVWLHSSLRGAIIPTPRQQGMEDEETDTASPRWSWARLLKRVFALDMARCPCCQRGGAANHRRYHAGRGDPQDPPASEARS